MNQLSICLAFTNVCLTLDSSGWLKYFYPDLNDSHALENWLARFFVTPDAFLFNHLAAPHCNVAWQKGHKTEVARAQDLIPLLGVSEYADLYLIDSILTSQTLCSILNGYLTD